MAKRRAKREVETLGPGAVFVGGDANDITTHITYQSSVTPLPVHIADPDQWPVLREWGAYAAGVHRAREAEGYDSIPPYVERDKGPTLRAALESASDGGFVLIVGESTAGKTRLAYECLTELFPERRVLVPPLPSGRYSFDGLVSAANCVEGPFVVWLDDLERFLGNEGLESGMVSRLKDAGALLVATMRTEYYERFSSRLRRNVAIDDERAGQWARQGISHVLNQADVISIERLWTGSEIALARERDDPRLVEATQYHIPYGIAEYLASAPSLWREWRDASRPGGHPRGAAIVFASIDLARSGIFRAVPEQVLIGLHEEYLRQAGGRTLRPETVTEAIEWASSVRLGVSSLLMPGEDPETWYPFDYLVDRCFRDPDVLAVSDAALKSANEFAAGEAEKSRVFGATYRAGVTHPGRRVVAPANLFADIEQQAAQSICDEDEIDGFDMARSDLLRDDVFVVNFGGGAPIEATGIAKGSFGWFFRSRSTSCQLWLFGPHTPCVVVKDLQRDSLSSPKIMVDGYETRGWRLTVPEIEIREFLDSEESYERYRSALRARDRSAPTLDVDLEDYAEKLVFLDFPESEEIWQGHIAGELDFDWQDYEASWLEVEKFPSLLRCLLKAAWRDLGISN